MFFMLLTILFIALKLTGFIAWPWFFVLCPLLVPFVMLIGLAFTALLVGALKG